ncbi:MAG: hypothetical protein RBR95_03485 [Ignavibacteriaceae bacterium]|jgi:hypothetical protein|nr:hypothetical protein [Ignavibacteriaceae bacterium]HPO55808.1 hypothetical protein [Ignavibacteriaceae bacterium]
MFRNSGLLIKGLTGFLFITAMILFSSCSDDPSSLGSALNQNNTVQVTTLDTNKDTIQQYATSFKKILALGSADRLLLGKTEFLEATTLIKFSLLLEDTYKNDLDSIEILEAKVNLTNSYSYGDSNGVFDFSAHKVTYNWGYSTFNYDSIGQLTYDATDISSERQITDSLISFKLDVNLVRSWLSDEKLNSSANTFGIYLKPTDNTRRIYGFWGYSGSLAQSIQPYITLILKKGTEYTDTVTYYTLQDIHLVKGELDQVPKKFIQVQSGLTANGKLFFDLSGLPSDAIINYAKLTLKMDWASSRVGSGYSEGVYAYFAIDTVKNEYDTPVLLERSDNTFSGNIATILNKMLNLKTNNGIVITPRRPLEGLEMYAIYGFSAVEDTLKPRLNLIYSHRK